VEGCISIHPHDNGYGNRIMADDGNDRLLTL
jgi:hypothetical protein